MRGPPCILDTELHACSICWIVSYSHHFPAGVKYVEASLPDSAGLASLLDQQALVQFLAGKLPEAAAAAVRMLDLAQQLFADEEAAVAMCSLRLGTALAGARMC